MLEAGLVFFLVTTLVLGGLAIGQRRSWTALVEENARLRRENDENGRLTEDYAARFTAIGDVVADAVLVVNRAREIIFLNERARRLFPGAEPLGRRFVEVTWGLDLTSLMSNALEGKVEGIQQTVIWDQRAFLAQARPIGSGAEFGAVVALQEITELQRLGRARRDFVANISHELRNPLAAIKMLVETLEGDALRDPQVAPGLLNKMDAEVDALKQLADELFDLAQIESGQAPLKLVETSLSSLLDKTRSRFAMQAERQGIDLRTVPGEPVDVLVDPVQFDKILGNLVHNALKFTPARGCVTVSAQPRDDMLEIRVEDTGIGIASNELPRIFERFYKVDRARTRGEKGTGLGLAIAKHLVEAHGGRIWAESVEGRGASFYFTVPCA